MTNHSARQALIWLNVGLRALMELGVVGGFAVWGYSIATGFWLRILLALIAPALGFGVWGLVDFRNAGVLAETLRLVEELLISGLAALAFHVAGYQVLGWSLAVLSIIHHCLVYLTGRRLLEKTWMPIDLSLGSEKHRHNPL